MLIDEVQSFARDFINVKSFRTSKRKAKIREAYKELTGKEIKITCNTCYIEALLIITNSKVMATRNYELKKGVLLQAFGDASKTCTNDTLTDELAEFYLKNYPEKAIFFSKIPAQGVVRVTEPEIKIIPPVKIEKPELEKIEPEVNDLVDALIDPIIKEPKKRKTNTKK
jgi:hypothetical protein